MGLFKRGKQKNASFSEEFACLIQKYGLEGFVDLRECLFYGDHTFTLVPIIQGEKRRNKPLPFPFIKEVEGLISRWYDYDPGRPFEFQVEPGKTREEILRHQGVWNRYCELAWGAE